jgi:hypothetical protein
MIHAHQHMKTFIKVPSKLSWLYVAMWRAQWARFLENTFFFPVFFSFFADIADLDGMKAGDLMKQDPLYKLAGITLLRWVRPSLLFRPNGSWGGLEKSFSSYEEKLKKLFATRIL